MANWYGIPGIAFHYGGPVADSRITFDGVTDSACIDVEATMWERFNDDGLADGLSEWAAYEAFDVFMRENADDVKELIWLARGGEV